MKERDVGANSIPLAASLRRPYLFGWQTQTSKWHTTTTTSPSLHATLIRQMESNKKKRGKKSMPKEGGKLFLKMQRSTPSHLFFRGIGWAGHFAYSPHFGLIEAIGSISDLGGGK